MAILISNNVDLWVSKIIRVKEKHYVKMSKLPGMYNDNK